MTFFSSLDGFHNVNQEATILSPTFDLVIGCV